MPQRPDLEAILDVLRALPRIGEGAISDDRQVVTPSTLAPLPGTFTESQGTLGGRRCTTIEKNAAQGAMLWLHGGGYCVGSPESHRGLGAAIAEASGRVVHLLDYRLAPEHPFPAAVDDASAALAELVDEHGADHVAIGGDSAGGGLALAAQLVHRDRGLPPPTAAICLSPWVDLTMPSTTHGSDDPLVSVRGLTAMSLHYLDGADPREPLASPVFAELSAMAPHLVIVGTEEVLLDDSQRVAARLQEHGVPTILSVWDDMFHVFPIFAGALPEADESIELIADFLANPPT